ncbi:MAG: hypothetical protein ABSG43_12205 [Solirubrobacteraceae bacterium]|jgi:hypothetical protein
MRSYLRSSPLTFATVDRFCARWLLGAIASIAILTLATAWPAAPAYADGDPASDVLATQALFLPQDAGVPAPAQARLVALLGAAQRSGYPIRVALIASADDLGSVTELWRQPSSYADFLGQELSLVYRGALLVVMPDGFGLDQTAGAAPVQRSLLASLRPPGPGDELASAALTAVARLAAAAGHPLPASTGAPQPGARPGSTDVGAWLAFTLGAAAIALAWSASLRARPPDVSRLSRRVRSSRTSP